MSKVTKRQYSQFCREFKKWQDRLGLGYYEITFEQKKIDEFANITPDSAQCIATVQVCLDHPEGHEDAGWVVDTAKHEALHLLLADIKGLAEKRYITEDELIKSEERIVRTLEGLI